MNSDVNRFSFGSNRNNRATSAAAFAREEKVLSRATEKSALQWILHRFSEVELNGLHSAFIPTLNHIDYREGLTQELRHQVCSSAEQQTDHLSMSRSLPIVHFFAFIDDAYVANGIAIHYLKSELDKKKSNHHISG